MRRWIAGGLGLLGLVCAAVAMWLVFDNPTIGPTSRGNDYQCLAPWDTVLNDASNFPGGEPPPDGDEIAARCTDRGEARFYQGVGAGAVAALLASFSVGLAARGDRQRRQTG